MIILVVMNAEWVEDLVMLMRNLMADLHIVLQQGIKMVFQVCYSRLIILYPIHILSTFFVDPREYKIISLHIMGFLLLVFKISPFCWLSVVNVERFK